MGEIEMETFVQSFRNSFLNSLFCSDRHSHQMFLVRVALSHRRVGGSSDQEILVAILVTPTVQRMQNPRKLLLSRTVMSGAPPLSMIVFRKPHVGEQEQQSVPKHGRCVLL